ncbi:MAG: transcriptional regulator GcvA [Gammaproteobacteria bacterium]|nr:transcriptional regulator GcvA [Gammaproteobacteria bacterium]
MARRLPPLNSLKSFEAAGRLLSFTAAARELNVTQAAISHQIKVIESYLGVALFDRYPRRLALTEQGKLLLPEVTEAFDRVSAAVTGLGTQAYSSKVSVRLGPSFAARWLSPRLKYFWLQYPEIDLSLFHVANAPTDFEREDIDLAVTYGDGHWPGVVAERLLALDFFPVCSPAFLHNDKPLTDIDNLRYYTLLHDADYDCWRDWLQLAGIDGIRPEKGNIIDDTNVLIQAAIDGQGIALGSTAFVQDLLESGRLVRPFDITLENELAYYVVCPESHLQNPAVSAFKQWLLSLAENQ